tara:strand:- start:8020 stop:8364 length:345 start_codon:yes stop_codon:yes gene_type:complete
MDQVLGNAAPATPDGVSYLLSVTLRELGAMPLPQQEVVLQQFQKAFHLLGGDQAEMDKLAQQVQILAKELAEAKKDHKQLLKTHKQVASALQRALGLCNNNTVSNKRQKLVEYE